MQQRNSQLAMVWREGESERQRNSQHQVQVEDQQQQKSIRRNISRRHVGKSQLCQRACQRDCMSTNGRDEVC